MKKQFFTHTGLLASLGFVCLPITAAEVDGIKLDNGALIYPSVYVGSGYEQNLALTNDNEINSAFWQITPSLTALLSPGNSTHEFSALIDVAQYTQSDADNYEDFSLNYEGGWEPTTRHRANWSLSQQFGHQKRGSQQTRFLLDRFDEVLQFNQTTAEASYEFGSKVAIGRLGIKGGLNKLEYTNFEAFTNQLNNNSQSLGGWFYYRVGKVTNLSFDVGYQATDYPDEPDPSQSRNSEVYTFLTGLVWEGLAKTTGEFKLGVEQRNFELADREDLTNLAIDAAITWEPKTYSIVNIALSRRTMEGALGSDATLTTKATLDWSHSWTEYSYSRIGYEYALRDEQGIITREDDTHFVYANFNRYLNEWLLFETTVTYLVNSSTNTLFDYDNQKLSIGLRVEL
ncbi:hypothetical protein EXU34_21650 [Alteromonas sp. ZYF713]|nr:hypothetical protein [Alteromonas sp. ZYF713]